MLKPAQNAGTLAIYYGTRFTIKSSAKTLSSGDKVRDEGLDFASIAWFGVGDNHTDMDARDDSEMFRRRLECGMQTRIMLFVMSIGIGSSGTTADTKPIIDSWIVLADRIVHKRFLRWQSELIGVVCRKSCGFIR